MCSNYSDLINVFNLSIFRGVVFNNTTKLKHKTTRKNQKKFGDHCPTDVQITIFSAQTYFEKMWLVDFGFFKSLVSLECFCLKSPR